LRRQYSKPLYAAMTMVVLILAIAIGTSTVVSRPSDAQRPSSAGAAAEKMHHPQIWNAQRRKIENRGPTSALN
jgi:hypothetical protein